ncbi:MAG: cobalt-precorrin-5B (C(1))-methyltransferase [Leptolyngbya foveolarum]|uniref:Cobalt-precorrin-5B C(1)-methyltransferase n=1 Tax=Leptolyngbya foveolarum TaxID=47253 RepID=A0A2W4VZG3_9CYAN|nr:MAG: cobalt-precorrin-5B (C(1))-methyltransferase [Leptolyngbya foveolarum]
MAVEQPRSGYTLPVFACAGAIAALQHLLQSSQLPQRQSAPNAIQLNLINPDETVNIPIEQIARLSEQSALAITRSDPGDNLDLTRHTPIWSVVQWAKADQSEQITLLGGEGIGRHAKGAAIYAYAEQLLRANLAKQLEATQKIQVTIILPEGERLALRTSNAAFGVVDGLSLLGTSGIAQPLSAPGQLEIYREVLKERAAEYRDLVFCLGENGLDLALKAGIEPNRRLKTANWIGPMLVEAGLLGVRSVLLFGYHGKLVKLAGGIFHTHHHVADGRQEILAACCVEAGLDIQTTQMVLASLTTEAGLGILRNLDLTVGSDWVSRVYGAMAERVDRRSQAYIQTHAERSVQVGSVLFDRQRKIICKSKTGETSLP